MAIRNAPNKSDLSKISAMVKAGYEPDSIARALGIKPAAVEKWAAHFKADGKITDTQDASTKKATVNK